MKYEVWIRHDKKRTFTSLERAKKFCHNVFEMTGIVLGITEVK